jgi:type IV secretion system protein VirD4
MPKLLKYTARRSPMQNSALTLLTLIATLVLAGAIPTQWWAWKFSYDARLGEPLLRAAHFALYAPTQWMLWGWRYADVSSLQTYTHVMFIVGVVSEVGAILLTTFVSYKLANYNAGMEGLHGTAHFAENEDIDQTGFIDSTGHKAEGVIVGSVILDGKGEVIHPHHPKFEQRYEPIMVRQSWKKGWRQIPKRDSNKRPMFKVRKSVVKKVKLLQDGGNTHIFGFCPTRSGKGVGMVVPTLLTWKHSVMVNDPKGEAWALTAGFRKAAGQRVIRFEPAGTGGAGACWNPLEEIRAFTERDVADSQMIMTMACDPKGKGLEEYFIMAAYEFLTAVALHVRYTSLKQDQKGLQEGSLAGCANYLGDPLWDSDKQMYTDMMQAVHDPEGKMGWRNSQGEPTKTHPMIANAAKTMLNKEDKDRSGVLSTAKSLLSLYLDPIVARNTGRSDFLVRDLMTSEEAVSLYYVVESGDMERMTPLTRLFYAIFIRRNAADMQFAGGQSVASYKHQLLMIIDEMPSLQKLPILQEALGYVAGYGIRMFFLAQDIVQVEELYGDKQSIDSGAETRIAYAPNKIETAEKLARMTGKTTVTEDSGSRSKDIIGIKAGNVTVSTSKTGRDLRTADEFMSLHDHDVVVFVKGKPPIYGRKAFYYENPTLLKRASMPPPTVSDKLRQVVDAAAAAAAKAAEVKAAQLEEHRDKWAAGRQAMRESIVMAAQPQAAYAGADRRAEAADASSDSPASSSPAPSTAVDGAAGTKLRSRYADQVKTISEEDRRKVEEIVASVGVVNKVVAVSAF